MENCSNLSFTTKKRPRQLIACGFFASAIFSSSILAQAPASGGAVTDPAVVIVGPFEVVPTIGISVEEDSNLFEEPDGQEVDSTLTLIAPAISATADNGVTSISFNYQLSNGDYSGLENNDYTDHLFSTGFSWQANVRHRIELTASIEDGQDILTPDDVPGNIQLENADPNQFKDRDVGFNYRFGADGARGRITVGVRHTDLEYEENDTDLDVEDLNSETLRTDVTVLLGLSSTTRTVFQVINTETELPNDSSRDRDELSYLVGVEWQISEQTLGGIRVGRTNTDLVNPDPGEDGSSSNTRLQANISWAPRSYTSFAFEALQDTQNTNNAVGNFVDVAQYSASWNYDWTSRITSSLSFGLRQEDFIGSADGREDDIDTMQLAINYSIRRWLTAGIAFATEEQRSSSADPALDYDKETFRAFVNMSL